MKLEIVTETDTVFSGEVEQVTLSSVRGELGILPEHLPFIAEIDPSVVSFTNSRESGKPQKIVVEAGYVHLENDTISLITSEVRETLPRDEVEKVRSELAAISLKIADNTTAENEMSKTIRRRNYLDSLLTLPSA